MKSLPLTTVDLDMSFRLFDVRMADGSRHFGDLPETLGLTPPEWDRLRDAVGTLAGSRLASFTTDGVTEAWVDFELGEHAFSINNQHGLWWFFVRDPACPDELLLAVLSHFERVLCPHAASARGAGPLPLGSHRVLVYEADGRVSVKDFASLKDARQYADDAASETEHGVVVSHIFDDCFRRVGSGKHY